MNWLILIAAFLLAAGATFVTNWLALIPWRRNRDKHWTERARLLYPAASGASTNLWTIPAILTLSGALLWPDTALLWLLTGIVSMVGAYGATLAFSHEVVPRIPIRDLLRGTALGWAISFFKWIMFIGAGVLMPKGFNWVTWSIAATVLIVWLVWINFGWIWFAHLTGSLQPPPERLRRVVTDTSAKMGVPCREILLMRSHQSQAYALPGKGAVIVTNRMLELFPDDELAAICAHELAHLTEPTKVRRVRIVESLIFFPWIFFVPLTHSFGVFPVIGLILFQALAPQRLNKYMQKVEVRADGVAKGSELDSGTYARALLRLHEDRLIPAVTSKEQIATHPDLYDRLIAAGVTPDFPKPLPAGSMAWHGLLFSSVAGLLFAILVLRITIPIMELWGT